MLIEDKIFAKKSIDPALLKEAGFSCVDSVYCLECELNSTFDIKVVYNDKLRVFVYDRDLGEEYLNFRYPSGSFSKQISFEVEAFLNELSLKIAKDRLYRFDQSQRINDYMEAVYGKAEFPFGKDSGIYKESGNQKWYALISAISIDKLDKDRGDEIVEVLNIKVKKADLASLLTRDGAYPAYHMNKQNWVSIVLNDSFNDNELILLINDSYDLVQSSLNERKFFRRKF